MKKCFIYVQHLLGIGHYKRMMALANGLVNVGWQVDLISGGRYVESPISEGLNIHQLPSLKSKDENFDTLLDQDNNRIDDAWKQNRTNQLLQLFESLSPDVLVTETYPFGRRMMRFELLPLLKKAVNSNRKPLIFSSVRDVLQPKSKPERYRETIELLNHYYDAVIVHSDDQLIKLEASFEGIDSIQIPVLYSGYIAQNRVQGKTVTRDSMILVSAGGGAVGLPLLNCAVEASLRRKQSGTGTCWWATILMKKILFVYHQ